MAMMRGVEKGGIISVPRLQKGFAILLFAANIFLTLFGFSALYRSPYTGIRASVCGDRACVDSVDEGSPAHMLIMPGDILLDVQDKEISYLAFSPDPDYIKSRKKLRIFWESQDKLSNAVMKGVPLVIIVQRDNEPLSVHLKPSFFPFGKALARTLPVYMVGWTFMVVAFLVLRKKRNEISVANFIVGAFVCTSFVTLAPYTVRDILFPQAAFRFLGIPNYAASQGFSYALFHMMLVFPRRKRALLARPWLTVIPYAVLCLVILLHFSRVFDNTHLTTYISMNACMILFFGRLVYDFFAEKDPLLRRQIKWVVFGTIAGITAWMGMTSLPIMFGAPIFSQELSVLPTVIYPLSFAFAITKYRLMDIDSIFDYALIYGVTILVLAGVELSFLSFTAPLFLNAGYGLHRVSLVAVLIIVFLYVPLRNRVKGAVDRLFRRGSYDVQEEIKRLMAGLSLCDNVPPLEKFSSFAKELMAPSGFFAVKVGGTFEATLVHSDGEVSKQASAAFMPCTAVVWEHLEHERACIFGFELAEKGLLGKCGPGFVAERAVFVPFLIEDPGEGWGYLGVLMEKWNGAGYSKKDAALLNAVSVNISGIIEAGELRREKVEMEEEFRRQRDHVVRELHDGLGSILTSITVTSQAAGRVFDSDPGKGREMVGRIGEYSAEGLDFMRTGLTVLDNPFGRIGHLAEALKERFGPMLSANGLEFGLEVRGGAGDIRPGAGVSLNMARFVQEALGNAIRHSGAGRVDICFDSNGTTLSVCIRDDGHGFNSKGRGAGHGLGSMSARARALGGGMELRSFEGGGTEVMLTVPVKQEAG